MTLRIRLMLMITAALILSLAGASTLAWWNASNSIETELRAALETSESVVRAAVRTLPNDSDPSLYLGQLVATFDGNRHVQAELTNIEERTLVMSAIAHPQHPAPAWFFGFIDAAAETIRFPVAAPPYTAVVLTSDPHSEVAEVWDRLSDDLAIMVGLCGMSLIFVYFVLGRGLKPLPMLSQGFLTISKGEYTARMPLDGSPELHSLANSFNRMAADLAELQEKNTRLQSQITTIQEEERADLARDLHDEVGPFLFAVNVEATAISRLAGGGNEAAISERVTSIQGSIVHMQRQVRDILVRLQPAELLEVGLRQALANLASFWQRHHAGTAVRVDMDAKAEAMIETYEAVIYRLVQECLTNAVRHGRASVIEVNVAMTDAGEIIVEVADDGIGLAEPAPTTGFGLAGMR